MSRGAKATAAAGVAACIACCAVPVLLAAGLLSAGLAAALAKWLPMLAAVLVGAALVAFAAHARRRSGSSCAATRRRVRLPARTRAVRLG